MFEWLKRGKRKPGLGQKRSRKVSKCELAPVEEIVEQQLSVAEVAVRMTVKNEIIMEAMGKHLDYDEKHIHELVKTTVISLAAEREEDAKQIDVMLSGIKRYGSYRYSESSYAGCDKETLLHRQQVYVKVAEQLREFAEQSEFVKKNADRARDLAWRDISDSLTRKANHPYYSNDHADGYEDARDARIDALAEDLAALQKKSKKAVADLELTEENLPVSFLH